MSESSPQEKPAGKISRRKFLKYIVGLGAGMVAGSGSARVDNSATRQTQQEKERDFLHFDEIQIGNMHLKILLTEHTESDWENHGQEILKQISEFSIVIPEYFPEEYKHLLESPLTKIPISLSFDYENKLFDHIQEFCLENGKEIYVVDPAYSEACIAYRATQNAPLSLVSSLAVHEIFDRYFESVLNPEHESEGNVNTEQILKKTLEPLKVKIAKMIQNVLTVSAAGTSLMFEKNSDELDIRHVLIAEGLTRLGETVPSGSRAVMIYPQEHWDGISNYLHNNEARKEKFSVYRDMVKRYPIFSDFLKIRHYTPSQAGWQELPDIPTTENKRTLLGFVKSRLSIRF